MEKHIEKLIQNLPDFVSDKLDDEALRKTIEEEIKSNPAFRAEYESIKNTFSFLGETAFSEPPEFYFNNLLPNINSRIDTLEEKKVSSSWLVNILKFAIPALIIVLGYFIYSQISGTNEESFTGDKNEEHIEENQNPGNDNVLSNVDDSTENNDTGAPVEDVSSDRKVKNNTDTYTANDDGGRVNINITAENSDELEEILYDNASYPVAGEELEEQVSQELSQQEQDELLNYLENAQL